MVEPSEAFHAVGGLRLFYLDWGGAAEPPLVLLHDLGGSADDWRAVAPALAERFHVIAVDLRGHGDSDWIDTYSPQEQGDDIGELINALGLTPAAVMGAGMGGRAGALLAARQEHAVSRLVVIGDGVEMYRLPEREAAEAILAMPRVYDSAEEYLHRWWALRASLGLSVRQEPPPGFNPERLVRRLASGGYAPKFDVDGYQRYRTWSPGSRSVDYGDEFDQITCPVLLVRGADTPLLPRDEAAATAAAIPDCLVVEVPNAGHDVLADNPAGLLAAVLSFLESS